MYGIVVSYDEYLETKITNTIEELLKNSDDIQGIFTGRYKDFVILGKILEYVDNSKNLYVVPKLNSAEEFMIRKEIRKKFGIEGECHYYFIRK